MRRSHYELAFEAYLAEHGATFVAVEELKRGVPGRAGIKLFDYIVYSGNAANYLIDVKGRKVAGRTRRDDRGLETWVTAADLAGLKEWVSIFGPGFTAAFVFAHWHPDGESVSQREFQFAGRSYSFRAILMDDYLGCQRVRSPRWQTVFVPRDDFRRLACPAHDLWARSAQPVAT